MTRRIKVLAVLLMCCSLFLLTGCTSEVERSYQSGEELLEQGKYSEAAAKFRDLNSYEDASRLHMYSRAAQMAENGDYETAVKAFQALGDFLDAPLMLRYYNARELESKGRSSLSIQDSVSAITQLTSAAEVYHSLSGFRDSTQREAGSMNSLYECGKTLLENHQYLSAQFRGRHTGGQLHILLKTALFIRDTSYKCLWFIHGFTLLQAGRTSGV